MGIASFVSTQPSYNMLDREIEAELAPFCNAYGVGILPYYPLANGFLTGKFKRGQLPLEGTRLDEDDRGMFTDANFNLIDKLTRFAEERGHTLLELAFSWLLANPMVSSVIAGARNAEQVVANAKTAGWQLTTEEKAQVDSLLDG